MNPIERSVSLHPYFKVHSGRLEAALALLPEFVARAATEEKMLYYEFTLSDDVIFCREAYAGADGVLAHVSNVGAQLEKMFALAELMRFEIHGPASELEKLKGSFAQLKPIWFAYQCGVQR